MRMPACAPPPRCFACLRFAGCGLATPPPTSIRAGSRPISFSLRPRSSWPGADAFGARGRYGQDRRAAVHRGRRTATGRSGAGQSLADQRATNLRSRQACCSRPVPARKRTSMPPRRCCATAQGGSQLDADAACAPHRVQPGRGHGARKSITDRAKWSPPTSPVLALLPPGNIKVRFFVPEAALPNFSYGDTDQDRLRRLRE